MGNSELDKRGIANGKFKAKVCCLVPRSSFLLLTFLVPAILAYPTLLWPQDDIKDSGPRLTALLDRDSAKIGSVVTLTLSYSLPEGAKLTADPEIKGLEDLTIVERIIRPDQIRIKLLVDRIGPWKTGPLSLSYLDNKGNTKILTAEPVSLTVLSNLGEKPAEAHLRPIQGIVPIKPIWFEYLPWTAGALGILITAFGIVWWYRISRNKNLPVIPEDPPHIRAKKEIEELEAQRLFEGGHVKQFYFRFSEILRSYLEGLRGFPAVESTTEEIALRVREEEDRKLLALLRQADLVKFADTIPTHARKEEEIESALSYIQETSRILDGDLSTKRLKGTP